MGFDRGNAISKAYGISYGAGMVFINKDGVVVERFLTGITEKSSTKLWIKIL